MEVVILHQTRLFWSGTQVARVTEIVEEMKMVVMKIMIKRECLDVTLGSGESV